MIASYGDEDFERAVAVVSAEPSPQELVERLGLEWGAVGRVARGCAAEVLAEHGEERGEVVASGAESFTAGLLIGVHLRGGPAPDGRSFPLAVDEVRERGRHAVIADHCDLASVARLETMYADALVESMPVAPGEREALRQPLTRIFEAGLAAGLALGASRPDT